MELRQGKPEEVGVSSDRVELIKQRTAGWVNDGNQQCIVIIAARQGVVFLHEAYGTFNSGSESPPVELDTIFPLTSLTKPFTAALAMTLVEEGLIGLNRPVADYIPDFNSDDQKKILIRHLLTHTSGIRDEEVHALVKSVHPDMDESSVYRWIYKNLDGWVEAIMRSPIHTTPDDVMMYADSNFELLAEVLKRVSGKDLDTLAMERVFHQLGMQNSHYVLPDEFNDRVVGRPDSAPIGFLETVLRKSPSGNSGLYSTVMDAATFGQMILNQGTYAKSRVLSSASVRAMTRNQIPRLGAKIMDLEFPSASWGLGWSINARGKGPLDGEHLHSSSAFGHGGAGGVFLLIDPALDLVCVYFSVVMMREQERFKGSADLFLNMVTTSIEDLKGDRS